jgi:hypothetical protein
MTKEITMQGGGKQEHMEGTLFRPHRRHTVYGGDGTRRAHRGH